MDDDDLKKRLLSTETLAEQAARLTAVSPIISDVHEAAIRSITPSFALGQEAERLAELLGRARDFTPIIDRFRVPELRMMEDYDRLTTLTVSPITEALSRYHMRHDALAEAMASLRSPWVDIENHIRSMTAMTELHGIGQALTQSSVFSESISDMLRQDLGDWREPLRFDAVAIVDPLIRSEFYVARGLNSELTDFPPEAFAEGLASAGIYKPSFTIDADQDGDQPTQENAFMRTNEAHDRLMRFEFQLRIFIDERMTAAIGPDWIIHRVPGDMRQAWEMKKQKAMQSGEAEQPLIVYADFTDYCTIIIRKDNWKELFGDVFQHKPSVEESFRRLYPVRIATMHARLITQDDALYLLTEIKRLGRVIGYAP